jgi:hypothetical protein
LQSFRILLKGLRTIPIILIYYCLYNVLLGFSIKPAGKKNAPLCLRRRADLE